MLFAACFASAASATFPGRNGKILFVSDGGNAYGSYNQFYTINPNGTGEFLLRYSLTENAHLPAYSPEGRKIALVEDFEFTFLRVLTPDGPEFLFATPFDNGDEQPAWFPNGRRLIFIHADELRFGQPGYLWLVNMDGTGYEQFMPATLGFSPAVSPDGTRIAFTAADGTLSVIRRNGSGVVTTFGPGTTPDWSPNSRALAFSRDGGIWTMNADGTMQIQRTSGAFDHEPVWSPLGSSIAFERDCGYVPAPECNGGNRAEIWVMKANGAELRRITHALYPCDSASSKAPRIRHNGLGGPLIPRGDGTCIGNGSYDPTWQPLPR